MSPNGMHLEGALGLLLALGLVGRADLTPLDVGEDDGGVRLDLEDVLGVALALLAGAGLLGVEPGHVAALVPPDGHAEDHAAGHGIAHAAEGAEVHEAVGAGGGAELIGDVVVFGKALDGDDGVLDDPAVLDVEAANLLELALVVGGELGDDGDGAGGVDGVAGAVVLELVDAVRVVAAAVLVADAVKGALVAGALVEAGDVAGVGGEVGGAGVGFPDVELVAAGALALDVTLGGKLVLACCFLFLLR